MKNLTIQLNSRGRKHLSNAQLLALMIGTGSKFDLDVAYNVLKKVGNNLQQLGRLSSNELQQIAGVSEEKASYIIASMEIGIRRESTPISQKPLIKSSTDAYNVLKADLQDLNHEEFVILLLSQQNEVIDKVFISVGGIAGTVVDVKKIFRAALANSLCAAVILGHNHPSNNLRPSKADISITKRIKEAGKHLDLAVLDHIIVAGTSYTILADEGLM